MLRSVTFLSKQVNGVSRFTSTKLPSFSNKDVNFGAPSSGDSFLFKEETKDSTLDNPALKCQNSKQATLQISFDKIKQFIEGIPHLTNDQKLYVDKFIQSQQAVIDQMKAER